MHYHRVDRFIRVYTVSMQISCAATVVVPTHVRHSGHDENEKKEKNVECAINDRMDVYCSLARSRTQCVPQRMVRLSSFSAVAAISSSIVNAPKWLILALLGRVQKARVKHRFYTCNRNRHHFTVALTRLWFVSAKKGRNGFRNLHNSEAGWTLWVADGLMVTLQ